MSLLQNVYAPVPPVIASEEKVEEKEEVPKSKIMIVHSKDVSKEELALFKFHGRYLQWGSQYVNIPFEKLPPHDYLFVDMREKDARHALGSVNYAEYSTVCFVPFYHKSEKFIEKLSAVALTSFPLRAISKEDFDRQLLNEKLRAPSLARSFLSLFLPCLSA
jgi:hypothetical protein